MARVLIVDDHSLFAEAITGTLEREGHEVVGVVSTGREALEAVRVAEPHVVLLDLGLPDRDGIEVGAEILRRRPTAKIIAVTARVDHHSVRDAVRVGFHGYVSKESALSELVSSVEAVVAGRVVIPRRTGQATARSRAAPSPWQRLADSLTPREREILHLLVEGATTGKIAGDLHIEVNTVRSHVQRLMSKLQVHSRLEAVAFATRNGLVGPLPRRTTEETPGAGPGDET